MTTYRAEYEKWLDFPSLCESEWKELHDIRNDDQEIESRFYAPLEFGTAGLRGTMKLGLHHMNIHVIRHATQAFANVIAAEGEEAKLAVEDKYYPYLKIREVEENLWKIYNETYTESYFLNEGLMLNQIGAEWIVHRSSPFFNPSITSPTISCVGDDCYDVTFDNTSINFSANATLGLSGYLTNWSGYTEEVVDANLTIRTNNQAFRSGEDKMLKFSVSGGARIHDRSEYGLQITIEEPIEMYFGTDGNMAKGTVGVGVITVKNTVTM